MNGGEGYDTLSITNPFEGVRLDMVLERLSTIDGSEDTSGVERAVGTEFDDVLLGDALPNTLIGGGGADRVDGRGGNDILVAETAFGGPGNDALEGTYLRGEGGDDSFSIFAHLDGSIAGGPGNDTFDVTDEISPEVAGRAYSPTCAWPAATESTWSLWTRTAETGRVARTTPSTCPPGSSPTPPTA